MIKEIIVATIGLILIILILFMYCCMAIAKRSDKGDKE